jgi:hypothetical protein
MLENPLNPDVTCLPNACTATRYELELDVGVFGHHPGSELLGAMNRPAINLPDAKLVLQKAQLLPFGSEVGYENVVNIDLHGAHS